MRSELLLAAGLALVLTAASGLGQESRRAVEKWPQSAEAYV
jgi:hypothetical protein